MRRTLCIPALLCVAFSASGQFVNYRGVVNAASYVPPGISGGQIAQGSTFSIFGQGIGPATLSQVSSFPLRTTLAGVSVQVTQGNRSVSAYPVVVTLNQVNAIMPSNAPLGKVSIQVTFNGSVSNTTSATVAPSSFGIFAVNSGGFGPGILQNYIAPDNQPINSLVQTAAPGQVVTLWGTGLGPVSADDVAPTPGNLATPVEIFVGGVLASSLYSGRSPCCSGIDQIVFTVPANAPLGCYVPVQIRTGGTVLSNAVTMAIQTGGKPCSDPGNPVAPLFAKGGKIGAAILLRDTFRTDVDVTQPNELSVDSALVTLRSAPGGPFFFNSALSAPPPGTCTMYSVAGRNVTLNIPAFQSGLGTELNAGAALGLNGTASASLTAGNSPLYTDYLGANDPSATSTLVLNPTGSTAVSAPGGTNVGAFQATVPAAVQLNWLNRLQINTIDRTQPLTVTWSPTGLANTTVAIAGSNYDLLTNATRTFICTASSAAGTFSVPTYILGAIPPSTNAAGKSFGVLGLAAVPTQGLATFTASGLDAGVAVQLLSSSKTVLFQ